MGIFGKRRAAVQGRQQHPDPGTEIRLRSIAAIDALRASALRQVAFWEHDITDAQEDLARATGRIADGWEDVKVKQVQQAVTGRIARAEEGIRRQHAVILGLNEALDKAVAESGLTDADLSYLNLEDQ
jgi:hypothetical protein